MPDMTAALRRPVLGRLGHRGSLAAPGARRTPGGAAINAAPRPGCKPWPRRWGRDVEAAWAGGESSREGGGITTPPKIHGKAHPQEKSDDFSKFGNFRKFSKNEKSEKSEKTFS